MTKIAMIGAGSMVFCRTLMNDILQVPELRDSTFHLMDIDPERLALIEKLSRKLLRNEKLPARVKATQDRREAIRDADYVVVMIQVGGLEAFRHDIEIPMKYGIDQCVGDTLGPGGVFRGLRTFPVLCGIAKDVEELCSPRTQILNYSNPMAMNTWAVFAGSSARIVGLCHGVFHTSCRLSIDTGIPLHEIDYWCAGINHMAWFLTLERGGEDLYPQVREFAKNKERIAEINERVRYDMFKHFGYFMTESSGHLSEYIPWYRKRKDLLEKYMGPAFGGESGAYLRMCTEGLDRYLDTVKKQIAGKEPLTLQPRSQEYCSWILEAMETGRIARINGNVKNTSLITNLPEGSCVEVPCFVDRLGIHPCHVGDLPPHCAASCRSNISVQEMAVKGGLSGDRDLVFQAILHDPLTMAVASPEEVRRMVDEMFKAEAEWLPQFRGKGKTQKKTR